MIKSKKLSLEENIFQNHYNYYKNIGVETIMQQSGQLEQVSADYQGRVIFELLQNAFDKAKEKVLVTVEDNSLFIANDGIKFNFSSEFDYKNGDPKRGDFQSLCSISTSTKNAVENIGNKGVGFKSAFSIAREGYVNVFTQGEIILADCKVEKNINFRLYNSFSDEKSLPTDFDDSILSNLKSKIAFVHKERLDRGVPGYYFPLQIDNRNVFVQQLFADGFVTVVEIPFDNRDLIKSLFEEIKKTHFKFIQLKYPNYPTSFQIKFCFDEEEIIHTIDKTPDKLFSTTIETEEIKRLAVDAGITIDKPQVSFYIRDEPGGLFYNYLPTKEKSPFEYVDFHADFHTTVDRKSINFDGKIGAYNTALLTGCLELYFSVINQHIEESVPLNLRYLGSVFYLPQTSFFTWKHLELKNAYPSFQIIRQILKISNGHYDNASTLFGRLALDYFSIKRNHDEHNAFFDITLSFLEYFARDFGDYYKWIDSFESSFARKIRNFDAKIIPDFNGSFKSEILYRENTEVDNVLPDFLGIAITDFHIKESFRKKLGIRDYRDKNEILKYFKQCLFTGTVSNEKLTEYQQKELLISLYSFFSKNDSTYLSTHRFLNISTEKLRDEKSSLNQANFAISTVFLKLKTGRFKPAQICRKNELDENFVSDCVADLDLFDDFLQFLGVSLDEDYIFADGRMYEQLKDGLDYIPTLINRTEDKETISAELLSYFYLINKHGRKVHPAVINDNDYSFLERITKKSIQPELENLLVKKYQVFPREYSNILKKRINENLRKVEDIVRLYQSVFKPAGEESEFLVMENSQLHWSKELDFSIVSSREDFDSITKIRDRKVLCYYSSQNLTDSLKKNLVTAHKGQVLISDVEEDKVLKENLELKMIYILLSISLSKFSEINFIEDNKSTQDLQKKIDALKIYKGNNLEQKVVFGNDEISSEKMYAFDDSSNLYLNKYCNNKQVAQGLSEFVFNNISIAESLQLILFYKTLDDLKNEYSDNNYISVIQRKWKSDFAVKYNSFQKSILEFFPQIKTEDEKWYIYNSYHKSEFLIQVDNLNQLEYLREIILKQKVKDEFQNYFDYFELEIDKNEIWERISVIKLSLSSITNSLAKSKLESKLTKLSGKLGCEAEIGIIENDLKSLVPQGDIAIDSKLMEDQKCELILKNRIDAIFNSLSSFQPKIICQTDFKGSGNSERLGVKTKKTIFQNSDANSNNSYDLELMGSSGEERVLHYFIIEFLKLDTESRIKGIEAVYQLLSKKLKNYPMQKYYSACINCVENDIELTKALIPLFYVTMHHKYSYFDLIVYKDGVATLIEVKTTYTDNNNRFFISLAEVDAARGDDNYEIVRDAPGSMNFLGNPIKLVENNLSSIIGENFELKPRNYEFKFKSS